VITDNIERLKELGLHVVRFFNSGIYSYGLYLDKPDFCCNGFECACYGQPVDPPDFWLNPDDWGVTEAKTNKTVSELASDMIEHFCEYHYLDDNSNHPNAANAQADIEGLLNQVWDKAVQAAEDAARFKWNQEGNTYCTGIFNKISDLRHTRR